MAVKIIVGNLLEAKENILCHAVNCQRKMGSGVALAIRKEYPLAYEDYMNKTEGKIDKSLLGQVIITRVGDDKYVTHLFTQLYYGYDGDRYTSYDAMYDSLVKIKDVAKKHNKSVALPYGIGSVRGGADWEIVYKMIERVFEDYEVAIYKLE